MNWPFRNSVITQEFGEHPEWYKVYGYPGHNGLDLWTPENPAFVKSVASGRVEKVGWEEKGYGKYVVLDHGSFQSLYAHLSFVSVKPGQLLEADHMLGIMGSTGNSTGPHLHLGIRILPAKSKDPYKGYVDPLPLLHGLTATLLLPSPLPPGASLPVALPNGDEGQELAPSSEGGNGNVVENPAVRNPLLKVRGSVFIGKFKNKMLFRMKRWF